MKTSFSEAVNWEYIHAHHPAIAGKIKTGLWLDRIIAHARANGFSGTITLRGAARIVNNHLY